MPLPFKNIWINDVVPKWLNKNEKIVFIFYSSFFCAFPFEIKQFFEKIREKCDCRIAILFGNPFRTEKQVMDVEKICTYADLVCSYNNEDRGFCGIKIHPAIVYNIETNITPLKSRPNDVVFVGQDKGRGGIINNLYNNLSQLGLRCDFSIVGESSSERINGIKYIDWVSYDYILERVSQAKCVLNLLQNGSTGVTIRDVEAYNSGCFLLTNHVDENLPLILHEEQIITTNTPYKLQELVIDRLACCNSRGCRVRHD